MILAADRGLVDGSLVDGSLVDGGHRFVNDCLPLGGGDFLATPQATLPYRAKVSGDLRNQDPGSIHMS